MGFLEDLFNSVSRDSVFETLEKCKIKKVDYTDEKNVQKKISDYLDEYYTNKIHREYNVGGFFKA